MITIRLMLSCAAALALYGCGETGPEPAPREPSLTGGVTIELPEPKAAQAPALPNVQQSDVAKLEAAEIEKAPAPPAAALPEEPRMEASKTAPPPPEAPPEAAAKADPVPPSAEASTLPLPNAVIARTIDRIGYACGAVASSARVEAATGETAYRITCTSGEVYRASDRSGRFRFRKWSE